MNKNHVVRAIREDIDLLSDLILKHQVQFLAKDFNMRDVKYFDMTVVDKDFTLNHPSYDAYLTLKKHAHELTIKVIKQCRQKLQTIEKGIINNKLQIKDRSKKAL